MLFLPTRKSKKHVRSYFIEGVPLQYWISEGIPLLWDRYSSSLVLFQVRQHVRYLGIFVLLFVQYPWILFSRLNVRLNDHMSERLIEIFTLFLFTRFTTTAKTTFRSKIQLWVWTFRCFFWRKWWMKKYENADWPFSSATARSFSSSSRRSSLNGGVIRWIAAACSSSALRMARWSLSALLNVIWAFVSFPICFWKIAKRFHPS